MSAARCKNWLFGRDGALFRAAALGNLDLVSELAGIGANIRTVSASGFTPLHRAAQNGHSDVVSFLVKNGADPFARAEDGSTPLSLAEVRGHKKIAEQLRRLSRGR